MRKEDKKFVKIELESRIRNLEIMIKTNHQALRFLEEDDFVYVAVLDSLWADHGEHSASGEGEDLSQAIRDAEENFKVLNKRSDVQALRKYVMKFPNGMEVYLPIDLWK